MRKSASSKWRKKNTESISYKGIPCDSELEYYFGSYLDELKSLGYVDEFDRSGSFALSEPFFHSYAKPVGRKTSSQVRDEKLLEGCLYTPDFKVIFTKKAYGKIVFTLEDKEALKGKFIGKWTEDKKHLLAIFEVKPVIDWRNTIQLFRYLQKWVLKDYEVFVNLVKVPEIFSKTFTPKEYLKTRKGNQRSLKYKPINVEKYLS